MISKDKKQLLYEEYSEIFNNAPICILLEMSGVNVSEVTDLRMKLREEGSLLKILKNRVAIKASAGTPFEELNENMQLTRALVYNMADPIAPAKMLMNYTKKNEKVSLIKGVFVSDNKTELLDPKSIVELGSLPSKEELVAKLLFLFNAPLTNFVRTINEIPTSFVRVLNAVAEQKQ